MSEIEFLKDLKHSINNGMIKNDIKTVINQRIIDVKAKEEKTSFHTGLYNDEQLPTKCLDGFDDDKFCDRSGECEWCEDIKR